jgi:hypothetical protein
VAERRDLPSLRRLVSEGIRPLAGKSTGLGGHYRTNRRDEFTVRMETIHERSHLPLHKRLLAFRLMFVLLS